MKEGRGKRWDEGKKKKKGMHIGKEELKIFLLIDDVILYLEDPKESNKKYKY